MNLDIRVPIGLLFALTGGMLTAFGVTSDPAIYDRSLGVNINIAWGVAMLAFALVMLGLALRKRRRAPGGE
jgi:hypothetical protein